MQFKKGRYRFVLIFPLLGIAIKFPVIRLWLVAKDMFGNAIHFRFAGICETMTYPIYVAGYPNWLFGGVVANWREFVFFWETRHPFLQPTYFSFFGLMNIQKAGTPLVMDRTDFWCHMLELTTNKVWDDCHHFEQTSNFCFCRGQLRILDYGDERTHDVIFEYGDKIMEFFDPRYVRKSKRAVGQ